MNMILSAIVVLLTLGGTASAQVDLTQQVELTDGPQADPAEVPSETGADDGAENSKDKVKTEQWQTAVIQFQDGQDGESSGDADFKSASITQVQAAADQEGKVEIFQLASQSEVFQAASQQQGFAKTLIMASLIAGDPHNEAGDTFKVVAMVTNVGENKAINVIAKIGGVPDGWVLEPGMFVEVGDIEPGETKQATWVITRDEEDATIAAWVFGKNTNMADTNRVKIPIHPLVIAGLAVSMGALYFRKRQGVSAL